MDFDDSKWFLSAGQSVDSRHIGGGRDVVTCAGCTYSFNFTTIHHV